MKEKSEVMSKLKEFEKTLVELEEKERELISSIENLKQFDKCVEEMEESLRNMEKTVEKSLNIWKLKLTHLQNALQKKTVLLKNLQINFKV